MEIRCYNFIKVRDSEEYDYVYDNSNDYINELMHKIKDKVRDFTVSQHDRIMEVSFENDGYPPREILDLAKKHDVYIELNYEETILVNKATITIQNGEIIEHDIDFWGSAK